MSRLCASVVDGRGRNYPVKSAKVYSELGNRPVTSQNRRACLNCFVYRKLIVESINKRDCHLCSVGTRNGCGIYSACGVGYLKKCSQGIVKTEKLYLLFISVVSYTVAVILGPVNTGYLYLSLEYTPLAFAFTKGIREIIEILIFGFNLNSYVYGILTGIRTLGVTAVYDAELVKVCAVYSRKVEIRMRRLRASVVGGRGRNYPIKLSEIYSYLGDRPIAYKSKPSAQDLIVKNKVVVKSVFKRKSNLCPVGAGIRCDSFTVSAVGYIEERSQVIVKAEKLYLLFIFVVSYTVAVILGPVNTRDVHLRLKYMPLALTLGEGVSDSIKILIFGLRLNCYAYGIFTCISALGVTAVYDAELVKVCAVYSRKVEIRMRRLRASVVGGRGRNYPIKLSEIYSYLGDRPIAYKSKPSAQDLIVKNKVVVKSVFKRKSNLCPVGAGIRCDSFTVSAVGYIEERSQVIVKAEKLYLLFIFVVSYTVAVIL